MMEKNSQKHAGQGVGFSGFMKRCCLGLLLGLALVLVFLLEYKADLRDKLEERIPVTMYFRNKENAVLELNDQNPVFEEDFICEVPDLWRLKLHTESFSVDDNARMELSLINLDSKETCYLMEFPAEKIRREIYKMTMDDPLKDSEGAHMRLRVRLITEGCHKLNKVCFTAGQRYGLVEAVNGDKDNKTNILYYMYYGKGSSLKVLYFLLCLALLVLAGLAYFLLVICRRSLWQAYLPLALVLGIIMTFVIPVHAVPDEPAHIDTAYVMANKLLGTGSPAREGYSYKRACDALMQDMMANTLEPNHYYQMAEHFLEKPEDTRLIEVVAMDAGRIVPRIVYVPAALGIALGRLLGLSSLMTFTLGRMINLLVYLLATGLALFMIPYGKNMLALVMLLPISMQQAASTSYDAILNSMIFLFIALCLRAAGKAGISRAYGLVLGLFCVFITLSKGAVYTPLLLLLLPVILGRNKGLVSGNVPGGPDPDSQGAASHRRKSRRQAREGKAGKTDRLQTDAAGGRTISPLVFVLIGLAVLLVLALLFAVKFYPVFKPVLEGNLSAEKGLTYTVASLLIKPQKIIYLLWNTFQTQADYQLMGLLGGNLAWREIQVNRVYPILLLICLLLLVHVDGDRFEGNKKLRLLYIAIAFMCITLVMLSMLIMFTARTETRIVGPQGRYYLVVFPLMLLAATNSMVRVNGRQLIPVAMTAMVTEILMVMSAFCLAF